MKQLSTVLEELVVAVTGNNADVNKALDDTDSRVDKLDKNVQSKSKQMDKAWKTLGDGMTNVGKGMTLGLTLPLAVAGVAAIKLASDMDETMNKVSVTFGENASAVDQWSKNSIKSMGLAQQSALDSAALYGDMASGMGLTAEAGYSMSTSLVQLSADMASFKNVSQDRAATALAGVFTGETEALKGLGIVMTEANLQQYAATQGITKNIQEMSQAEKVQLRYAYVMSVTSNAQGDFARTGGGAANQARMLAEQAKEAGTRLGQNLLPMATKFLNWANNMMSSFNKLTPSQQKVIIGIAGVAAAIGPVLLVGGKLITGIQTVKKFGSEIAPLFAKIIAGLTGTAAAGTATAAGTTAAAAGTAATGVASAAATPPVAAFGVALNVALPIVGLIVAGVTALAVVFNKLSAPTEEMQKMVDGTKEVITAVNDAVVSYEDSMVKMQAQGDVTNELVSRLSDLSEKSSLTRSEQTEMADIVSQLNSYYPELNLAIDQNSWKLNKNMSEIKKVTSALLDQQDAMAEQEAYNKMIEERGNLLIELKGYELQYGGALKNSTLKFIAQLGQWGGGTAIVRIFNRELGTNIANYAAAIKAYEEGKISLEELNATIEKCSGATDESTTTTDTNTVAMQDNTAAIQAKLEAGQALTAEELTNAQTLLDSGAAFTEEEKAQIDAQTQAYEDAKEKYKAALDERLAAATNFFEKINQGEDLSVQQLIDNLSANATAVADWTTNINNLANSGLDKGFLATLEAKGLDAAQIVQNMVDYMKETGDRSWVDLNAQWSRSTITGINAVEGLMLDPKATSIASGFISANARGVDQNAQLKAAASNQVVDSKIAMVGAVNNSDFPRIGSSMVSGMIEGLNSQADKLYAVAEGIASEAAQKIRNALQVRSPSRVTFQIFQNVGKGAVMGLESMLDEIKRTSNEFAVASIAPLSGELFQNVNTVQKSTVNKSELNINGGISRAEIDYLIRKYVSEMGASVG